MKIFAIIAFAFLGLAKDDKIVKIQGNFYKVVKVWNEDRTALKTSYIRLDKNKNDNNQDSNPKRHPNVLRNRFSPINAISDLSTRMKNIRSEQNQKNQNLVSSQPNNQKVDDLQLTIAATVPISQIDSTIQKSDDETVQYQNLSPLSKFVPNKINDFFQNSRPAEVLKNLEEDQQNNLTPAETKTNIIKGKNNTILSGQFNEISGKQNLIKQGNLNQIRGDSNTIQKGNRNRIRGQGSYVSGDDNIIH